MVAAKDKKLHHFDAGQTFLEVVSVDEVIHLRFPRNMRSSRRDGVAEQDLRARASGNVLV